MSQDFSVFGWMLPEQEMDVLIIPVIISLIGYIILFIIIHKLMKRFLTRKPWHKYLRRGIWISIFTLMCQVLCKSAPRMQCKSAPAYDLFLNR